jgi:hypothetical protein
MFDLNMTVEVEFALAGICTLFTLVAHFAYSNVIISIIFKYLGIVKVGNRLVIEYGM